MGLTTDGEARDAHANVYPGMAKFVRNLRKADTWPGVPVDMLTSMQALRACNEGVLRMGARRFRRSSSLVAAIAVLAVGVAGCGRSPRAMPAPSGTGTSGPSSFPALKVLTFSTNHKLVPGKPPLPLVAANASAISALAPMWYKVMPNGSVRDLSMNNVKTYAAANHIAITPLVANYNGTSSFLLSAAARNRAVAGLTAVLKRNHYGGLNLDFELLKASARTGLTDFVKALDANAHSMGKTVTVDVIPAGSRRSLHYAYNFSALAHDSNGIVLMTYDAHDSTSKPGPIAPLTWVKMRVKEAMKAGVPANKLILGLADYGYDWAGRSKGHTVGLKQAMALSAKEHAHVARNRNGSPHFTYTAGGVKHTVWYEDSTAILPKIRLARQLHLEGLALWRAGYETPSYWKALRQAAGTAGAPVTPKASAASSSSGASTTSGGLGSSASHASSSPPSSSPSSSPSSAGASSLSATSSSSGSTA